MIRTSTHHPSKVTKSTTVPVLKLRDTSKVGKVKLEEMYQAVLKDNNILIEQVAQLKAEKKVLKSQLEASEGEKDEKDGRKATRATEEKQELKELGAKIWLLEDQAKQCPNKGYHGFKVRLPAKGV